MKQTKSQAMRLAESPTPDAGALAPDSSGGSDDQRHDSRAQCPEGEEATVPDTALAALAILAILARLHHIAAEP